MLVCIQQRRDDSMDRSERFVERLKGIVCFDDDGNEISLEEKLRQKQAKKEQQSQWRDERIWESSHAGAMVAFFLKPSEARQLALPNGESVDQLHVTLAYLGDLKGDTDKLKQTVAEYARASSPLQGVISGIGRFLAVSDGDLTSVYASVDLPGLPEWRQGLVQALIDVGFTPSSQHGYSPHITLSYIPKSAPMPIQTIPTIPLNFDTVWLAIGDDRYAFSIGTTQEHKIGDEEDRWIIEEMLRRSREKDRAQFIASQSETSQRQSSRQGTRENEGKTSRTQEASETPQEEIVHWQDSDPIIQKQIVELKAKGVKTLGPWDCHAGACDDCMQNQGQTVEVGQRFKSGCYISPNHNHCKCAHKENM